MFSFFLSSSLTKPISHSKSSSKKLTWRPNLKSQNLKLHSYISFQQTWRRVTLLTPTSGIWSVCPTSFSLEKKSWYTNHNKVGLLSGLWKVYFSWTVASYLSSKLVGIFTDTKHCVAIYTMERVASGPFCHLYKLYKADN